jgi:histidine ammonia-lyase
MTLEALLGSKKPMMAQVHELRPHKGQISSAANLTRLLANSEIMDSHEHCSAVQDAYSLRCMPQVHGASRQAVSHAREVLEIEFNAVTDNPLVIDGNMVSQGNFHGQPVALVMDYFAIAMSELANISERRLERLVNPTLSRGLPPFLTIAGGLNSGYMIAQYTAAALVSENKTLCHPASVDSIPTSANQEDHVSMGTIGARKARDILKNSKTVLAIELLCALQALDLRLGIDTKSGEVAYSQADIESRGKRPGSGVEAAYKCAREIIPFMEEDRPVWLDIEKAIALLDSGDILTVVEKTVGVLD